MIGLSGAIGLAGIGLKVAVVEARKPPPFSLDQAYDLRVSALTSKTVKILSAYRAWPLIEKMRFCNLEGMRVWEQPAFGDVSFNSQAIGKTELGAIVENRIVQLALWEVAEADKNIELFFPCECSSFHLDPGQVIVRLKDGKSLSARLLIGTDGMKSSVRKSFPFASTSSQYEQSCLVASARTLSPQPKIAWQRFKPEGPQAYLPLTEAQGSIIWYNSLERVKELSVLSCEDLSERLNEEFPIELGLVEVQDRASFPISKHHVKSYVHKNVILAGDAAHTINPLAGQGVNLGFQDIEVMTKIFRSAIHQNVDWSSAPVLRKYDNNRRIANSLMMGAIDAFYHGFSNNHLPLKILRNTALRLARIPIINQQITRYGSGLSGLLSP